MNFIYMRKTHFKNQEKTLEVTVLTLFELLSDRGNSIFNSLISLIS